MEKYTCVRVVMGLRIAGRKVLCASLVALMALGLVSCRGERVEYVNYSDSFFDTFDTVVTVVAYTKTQEEFLDLFDRIHLRMAELHKLYDIYNEYEGVNNVRTVNKNAGISPVPVAREIIDLLLFSRDWYHKTGERVNVAFGPVLRIWHDYRTWGTNDPEAAQVPPWERLQKAAQLADMDKVVVDEEESTVFLLDVGMSLDVGAVAKGFATEIVAREMEEAGVLSMLLSSGGNIRAIGKPLDGVRERWGVGLQNPEEPIFSSEGDNLLDVIFVRDAAAATSGGYQRYYKVDDTAYHHIIDPETLFPADYHLSVTAMADDAGVADFMSTALFLLPYEEGRELLSGIEGVEAIWVLSDGSMRATEGMERVMRSKGASGATPE